jgi:hypothetical protein
MKNKFLITSILAISLFACSSDDDSVSPEPNPTNTTTGCPDGNICFTVRNNDYVFPAKIDTVGGIKIVKTDTNTRDVLSITLNNLNLTSYDFSVDRNDSNKAEGRILIFRTDTLREYYITQQLSGTLNLMSANNTFSGDFNCMAYDQIMRDTIQISNGIFNKLAY